VVSIVGTRDDPQGLDEQVGVLVEAGAWVYRSNAEAARAAVDLVTGGAS
jgi:FdrA protein